MQDSLFVSSRSLLNDVSAGAGSQSGSSSPQASIPDIRGNASCSVQASMGSKWEHGHGIWRAALDLVNLLSCPLLQAGVPVSCPGVADSRDGSSSSAIPVQRVHIRHSRPLQMHV